jgi:hypothetical protein
MQKYKHVKYHQNNVEMDTVSQEKLDYGKGILSSINTEILK